MDKVGFEYGCFGKPLEEQAIKQGFELKNADKYEKIRHAINMCGFHVATNSQVNMMFKKLTKQVSDDLSPLK